MKYLLLFLGIPFLVAGDCGSKKDGKSGSSSEVPSCVQRLIDEASRENPPTTPVRVDEYIYKGKKVYLFTSPCCDFYNLLYDADCRRLCAPSGGIAGRGDGKCPDFDSTAKKIKEIWTNSGK